MPKQKKLTNDNKESDNRRKLMLSYFHRFGFFKYTDIHDAFGKVANQSLLGDIKAIKNAGYKIEKHRKGHDVIVYWVESRVYTVKQFRAEKSIEEKDKIARLVISLICGFDDNEAANYGLKQKELYTQDFIRKKFNDGKAVFPEEVLVKLLNYWGVPQRSLSLDSGTTTDAIANKIFPIEVPNMKFSHLKLWTNSRSIFERTGVPECAIKTVIIGGEQRYQSETVSGDLAQKCLSAWDPSFGISIVGTTGIDLKKQKLGAYNDSESAMKAALLSRGELRIVVADSSKFHASALHSGSHFSIISPDFIDLIITDSYKNQNSNLIIPKSINNVPVLSF